MLDLMRDSRIDVARGVLIIGVVVGHLWERSDGWESGILRFALTALYAVHMPAFVFLTGFVAKPAKTGQKILGLLSVLVVFQVAFIAFLALAGHPLKEWYWPYWVLWFIMAMIWWQLTTPFIARWPKTTFIVAMVAALAVGAAEPAGNWFTYQRAIVFLPFYVAGMAWGSRIIAFLQGQAVWAKGALVAGFAVAAMGLVLWNPEPHWLFHNWTYGQLDVDPATGAATRIAVLAIGALGAAALLAVVSGKIRALAWVGERTLPVFIFHVVVVSLYGWYVYPLLEDSRGTVLVLICAGLGVSSAFLFALKPFVAVTTMVRNLPLLLFRRL